MKELSSFDIYVLVAELQDLLEGYIDNIYQLTRSELLIRVNNRKKNQKETLYIENAKLFCRTNQKFTVPQKPSTFTMTLRKYLSNGRVTQISQQEFDRIIIIKISKKEGDYALVFELFPKGNILLLDPQNNIILPLITQRWSHRTLQSKQRYIPPPSQINPFAISFEEFASLLQSSSKDIVRTLAVTLNMGGAYAEEICVRAKIDKNIKVSQLDETTLKHLFSELETFLSIFSTQSFQPLYIQENGTIIDILPIPFKSYESKKFLIAPSFSLALQQFITPKDLQQQLQRNTQKKIEKFQRQLTQQHSFLQEFQQHISQKKTEGELIYLHFQEVEILLKDIQNLLIKKNKEEGITQIQHNPLVSSFDPTSNELIVILTNAQGHVFNVSLDFRKSVAENAELAYETSKKQQEKLKGAQEAILQTKQKIADLQKQEIRKQESEEKKEKTFWFERFRWFITSAGNVVIAGRDAKTNEVVVKKYLKEGDRYVHADIHGAPSCIVKCSDTNATSLSISEESLTEACIFAAAFSKAWNQFAEAQSFWVLPEQVSKTPQSGEFVPKGAFIIRGKRNYCRCKLEVAMGKVTIEGVTKIMCGPPSAITSRTDYYVILEPGTTEKNVLSNTLAKKFHTSSETIARVLPPGKCTIVRTAGVSSEELP